MKMSSTNTLVNISTLIKETVMREIYKLKNKDINNVFCEESQNLFSPKVKLIGELRLTTRRLIALTDETVTIPCLIAGVEDEDHQCSADCYSNTWWNIHTTKFPCPMLQLSYIGIIIEVKKFRVVTEPHFSIHAKESACLKKFTSYITFSLLDSTIIGLSERAVVNKQPLYVPVAPGVPPTSADLITDLMHTPPLSRMIYLFGIIRIELLTPFTWKEGVMCIGIILYSISETSLQKNTGKDDELGEPVRGNVDMKHVKLIFNNNARKWSQVLKNGFCYWIISEKKLLDFSEFNSSTYVSITDDVTMHLAHVPIVMSDTEWLMKHLAGSSIGDDDWISFSNAMKKYSEVIVSVKELIKYPCDKILNVKCKVFSILKSTQAMVKYQCSVCEGTEDSHVFICIHDTVSVDVQAYIAICGEEHIPHHIGMLPGVTAVIISLRKAVRCSKSSVYTWSQTSTADILRFQTYSDRRLTDVGRISRVDSGHVSSSSRPVSSRIAKTITDRNHGQLTPIKYTRKHHFIIELIDKALVGHLKPSIKYKVSGIVTTMSYLVLKWKCLICNCVMAGYSCRCQLKDCQEKRAFMAKAGFILEDGTGLARFHCKKNLVRIVLGLNSVRWTQLKDEAMVQSIYLSKFNRSSDKNIHADSNTKNIIPLLKSWCATRNVRKRLSLHVHCFADSNRGRSQNLTSLSLDRCYNTNIEGHHMKVLPRLNLVCDRIGSCPLR